MNQVRLTVSARSDTGRVRGTNEDAFTVTNLTNAAELDTSAQHQSFDVKAEGVLLAVSDGMGGHRAGAVASAVVLDSLRHSLLDAVHDSFEKKLELAVTSANRAVLHTARATGQTGMGATLTAVLVTADRAFIAEVGDSRAYLLRSGKLRQLTHDQSLVQMLVDCGALSPDEARDSPRRNIVVQAMGLKEDVRVAMARLELRRGDKIFLCSDGVTNVVSDSELSQILANQDAASACTTLIDLANDRGGVDNVTTVAASVDGPGLAPCRASERVTGTFQVLREFGGVPGTLTSRSGNSRPSAATATRLNRQQLIVILCLVAAAGLGAYMLLHSLRS
jgi:serine/threonine protein phosphatase PrpC